MMGTIINVSRGVGVIVTPGRPRIRATFRDDDLWELPFSRRLIGVPVLFDMDNTPSHNLARNVRPRDMKLTTCKG